MVSLNSTVSCGTMPIGGAQPGLRHVADVLAVDEDACRPTRHRSGTDSREMVDLPAPDGPTMATVLPAGTSKEMPFRIGRSGS